ncbi:MAG: hypothetical protein ABIQ09_14405 [Jatrophihabitantaceae bacterium]
MAQVICGGRTAAELRQRADVLGRELDELRANGLAGSLGEVVDKRGAFAGIGASRVYLQLMNLTDLDQLELIAAEVTAALSRISSSGSGGREPPHSDRVVIAARTFEALIRAESGQPGLSVRGIPGKHWESLTRPFESC